MKATTTFAAIAFSLAGAGCYTQRPLEVTPPPPATRIIAELTDSGTVAMSNAIGPGALGIEGVVVSADDRVWTLQMVRVDHRDGRSIDWNREPVSFTPNFLTRPNVKVLDKKKSWLAGAGITIGAFVLARTFNLLGASEEGDDDTPPANAVIPSGGR